MCAYNLNTESDTIQTPIHVRLYHRINNDDNTVYSACHISPLKSLKRINCSTSPRSGHDPARGFVINLWLLIRIGIIRVSVRLSSGSCFVRSVLMVLQQCTIAVDLPVRSLFLACTGSLSVVIHISVSSGMGSRSLAARCRESKFSFCCCFCFWSNALNSFRYGH